MHLLDLAGVLRQICLVLAPEDNILVVRPPDLLVGEKVVAGLLLLSLDLLLQASCNVRETLLAHAILPAEALTRRRTVRVPMVHIMHLARCCRVHFAICLGAFITVFFSLCSISLYRG